MSRREPPCGTLGTRGGWRSAFALALVAFALVALTGGCSSANVTCNDDEVPTCDNAGERCFCAPKCEGGPLTCPLGYACSGDDFCYPPGFPGCAAVGEACDPASPCCEGAVCQDGTCTFKGPIACGGSLCDPYYGLCCDDGTTRRCIALGEQCAGGSRFSCSGQAQCNDGETCCFGALPDAPSFAICSASRCGAQVCSSDEECPEGLLCTGEGVGVCAQ